jgi:hypothetical protein
MKSSQTFNWYSLLLVPLALDLAGWAIFFYVGWKALVG